MALCPGGGTVSAEKIRSNARMSRMYLAPIKEGMYLSDEPGFYKPGEFGIRIESDLVVCAAETRYGFGAPDAALTSGPFQPPAG